MKKTSGIRGMLAATAASAMAIGGVAHAEAPKSPTSAATMKFENPGLYGVECRTPDGQRSYLNSEQAEKSQSLQKDPTCADVRAFIPSHGQGGDTLAEVAVEKAAIRKENAAHRAKRLAAPAQK